jgi:hypothetical protein
MIHLHSLAASRVVLRSETILHVEAAASIPQSKQEALENSMKITSIVSNL